MNIRNSSLMKVLFVSYIANRANIIIRLINWKKKQNENWKIIAYSNPIDFFCEKSHSETSLKLIISG